MTEYEAMVLDSYKRLLAKLIPNENNISTNAIQELIALRKRYIADPLYPSVRNTFDKINNDILYLINLYNYQQNYKKFVVPVEGLIEQLKKQMSEGKILDYNTFTSVKDINFSHWPADLKKERDAYLQLIKEFEEYMDKQYTDNLNIVNNTVKQIRELFKYNLSDSDKISKLDNIIQKMSNSITKIKLFYPENYKNDKKFRDYVDYYENIIENIEKLIEISKEVKAISNSNSENKDTKLSNLREQMRDYLTKIKQFGIRLSSGTGPTRRKIPSVTLGGKRRSRRHPRKTHRKRRHTSLKRK